MKFQNFFNSKESSSKPPPLSPAAVAKIWKQEQYQHSLPEAAKYARQLDTNRKDKVAQLFSRAKSFPPKHKPSNESDRSIQDTQQSPKDQESADMSKGKRADIRSEGRMEKVEVHPSLADSLIGQITMEQSEGSLEEKMRESIDRGEKRRERKQEGYSKSMSQIDKNAFESGLEETLSRFDDVMKNRSEETRIILYGITDAYLTYSDYSEIVFLL